MSEENPEKLSRQEVKKQLAALTKEFQKLPTTKTRKPQKPDEDKQLDSIQETISYLRVCIKYNVFDLEACRREIKYLREKLESENK